MNNPHESLTDRIRAAESPEEIEALLEEGRHYENANNRTRSRWKRKAKQRLQQLAIEGKRTEL
jgi:hypothetical protein